MARPTIPFDHGQVMDCAAKRKPGLLRAELESLDDRIVPAVSIRFDYTYDTTGFFNSAERRAALQNAAQQIAPRIDDQLQPIQPSGSNRWTANFWNLASQQMVTLENPTIRENEIVVYVAGTPLNQELGLTSGGGYSAVGSRDWLNQVATRGQPGAQSPMKTDFATWGGFIAFNSRTNWHFGTTPPAADQYDFTSVALHELLHVFGFGMGEPAFTRHISNGQFMGPAVVSVNGGPVSVVGSPPDHFAPGTAWNGQESPMQPALAPGVKRSLTALEYAVLEDIGWQVSDVAARGTSPVVVATVPPMAPQSQPVSPAATQLALGRFAVGTNNAATVYGSSGEFLRSYQPYGPNYTGGIRVATADVTGDGAADLLVGSGANVSSNVFLVDGLTFELIAVIQPFESAFQGGVWVVAEDINQDGHADVIVTPDMGGGPVVVVYDGAALAQGTVRQLNRFFGLNDRAYRGGLRPALGDLNRDGTPDLVVSAGFGGGPRVAMIDGRSLTMTTPVPLAPDFFAFEPSLRNGATIAVLDVNGDGYADVVAGAGPGGGPRLTVFNGLSLLNGQRRELANFFAGNINSRTGVRVAAQDVDGDGRDDLLVGLNASTLIYAGSDLLRGAAPPAWMSLAALGQPSSQGLAVG